MRALSMIQMLLFFAITFYLIYKGLILTEYVFFGVIFGLLIHWSLTNKGNKNIMNLKPLSAGFRVFFYDICLATILIRGVLEGFDKNLVFLCVILIGLIILDYFVEG